MPLDNSLNVSELFRRLGIKGDSLGSAPLLESLRLSLVIGDLSQLVPPLLGPLGGASMVSTSGVGTNNQWALECRAPGGLRVLQLYANVVSNFSIFITDANPFGAIAASAAEDFSFGQAVQSIFSRHVPAAGVAPANTLAIHGNDPRFDFENWVGPGQFFNVEAQSQNLVQRVSIFWKEYPAGINPG